MQGKILSYLSNHEDILKHLFKDIIGYQVSVYFQMFHEIFDRMLISNINTMKPDQTKLAKKPKKKDKNIRINIQCLILHPLVISQCC